MDYCKYVNVFQGTGEIDLPKPEGIAAKWFFLKAGCGNTSPAALVPFGAMSVSPFSGGYPTGYGNHCMNSHSRPPKFADGKKLIGFSHLHQSGTGAIEYYYNYAITTPKYADSPYRRLPENEYAEPGYYSCFLEDIKCELTAAKRTALHRYTFAKSDGFVTVDFSSNGLYIPDYEPKKINNLKLTQIDDYTVCASAVAEGVKFFFAVKGNVKCEISGTTAVFSLNEEKTANISLAVSLRSEEKALAFLNEASDFDETRKSAKKEWNKYLSKIEIETSDEKLKEIFYSNFYHSLIKPSDWSGESFIYGGDGAFVSDFATLWDMYKTVMPMIFMLDREMSKKIVETLLRVGETLGEIPNSLGICDRYKLHSAQARMLGDYVLITAYRYGIPIDVQRMLKVIETDIFADNKRDFTVDGKCSSATWMLDMADGCALTAKVAEENGNYALAQKLIPLSRQWKTVYDKNTGLLTADSVYYEGTLYNYSFRQMVEMDERIEIAGGKEKFAELLDRFFGYGQPDVVQPTDYTDRAYVKKGEKLGRFEGFNNEPDIEAPFSYIFADRHDRTCEIIRAGMKYMFTTGTGGLPGNNDSGALTSYYVLNVLGLFPVAGQDLFLIGSPVIDGAKVHLSSGKVLEINVKNNSEKNIYVKSVKFNSKPITDFRISAHEIMNGGTLEFEMLP